MNWFYLIDGEKFGPVTHDEFKILIRKGTVKRDTLVWKNGMDSWSRAVTAVNIFPPSKKTTQNEPKNNRFLSFFITHWQGNFPILISIWGMLFVASLFFIIGIICFYFIFDLLERKYIPLAYWGNILFFSFFLFSWYLKGSVHSIIKNTKQAEKSHNNFSFVLLAAISLVYIFNIYNTVLPNFLESIDDAKNKSEYVWDIEVINDGFDLVLSGAVGDGIAEEFKDTLLDNRNIKTIHTNLDVGGYMEEAEMIAEMIKLYELETYVSTVCVSACIKIFLRGKKRFIKEDAKLGFHRPSFPGLNVVNFLAEDSKQIFLDAGVSPSFVEKIFNTPSSEMWYPTKEELLQANVIDNVVTGKGFAMSELNKVNVDDLEKYFLDISIYVVLKNKEPEIYKKILEEAKLALLDKKSLEYIIEMGSRYIQPLRDKHLPYANNEVLLEFNSLVLEQLEVISKTNKVLCYEYGYSGTPESMHKALSLIPDELIKKQVDLLAKVFETSDFSRKPPDENIANIVIEKVVDKTITDLGDNSEILLKLDSPSVDKGKACDALKILFRNVLALPNKEAEIYFRATYLSAG